MSANAVRVKKRNCFVIGRWLVKWWSQRREWWLNICLWKECNPRKFIKTWKILLATTVLHIQLWRLALLSKRRRTINEHESRSSVPKHATADRQVDRVLCMVTNDRRAIIQHIANTMRICQSNSFCLISFIWENFRQFAFHECWPKVDLAESFSRILIRFQRTPEIF